MLFKAKQNQYHTSDEGKKCSLHIVRVVFLSQHRATGIHRPASSPVCFNSNKWEISNNISKVIHNLKAKPLLQMNLNYTSWWCGGWATVGDTVQPHCAWKKTFKETTCISLPRTQSVNSQSRVWGKGEEWDSDCFLQCANQDQKALIPPKSKGMIQPAPAALQDWWYLHSADVAHFGTQSSW